MRTLLAAALIAMTLPATAMACSQPSGATALEQGLVQWINKERQARGVHTLRSSAALASAARQHGCDMATRGFFAHQRAGGPTPGQRAKANGYQFRRVTENLAYSRTAKVATAAEIWRNSPPHWANVLDPKVNDVGVSVTTSKGRIYWVMNVGRLK
ncbi:MAG: CAP domain-containing protein [Paracoccaceae bacterium]